MRPARPLPYDLAVDEIAGPRGVLSLRFVNSGTAGASFTVYREETGEMPRRYTVGANDRLVDGWSLAASGANEISVMGPNDFLRRFRRGGATTLRVAARADAAAGALELALFDSGTAATSARLSDNAYGERPRAIAIAAGAGARVEWTLAKSGHWYDLLVEGPDGETTRLAGHVETGRPGITDPAAIAPVLDPRP